MGIMTESRHVLHHQVRRFPRALDHCDARVHPQTLFFKAATGNAFTIVRAGLAFTICIFPKISFLQALVAGFWRVLILQRPGNVKMPFFCTSLVAMAARLAIIFPATVALSSHSSAICLEMAPLVMGLPVAPFIAFMGAMLLSAEGSEGVQAAREGLGAK